MKNKVTKIIGSIIVLLFALVTIYFIITLNNFGIIPGKYLTIIYIIMLVLMAISIILITRKNLAIYIIGIISVIIISSGYLITSTYIKKANDAINKIATNKITSVNYYVLVRKDSNIKNINDLKDKKVGYMEDNNSIKLKNLLLNKVKCNTYSHTD